jgi:pyruvate,water dikinase
VGASGRTITPGDPGIISLDAPRAARPDLGAKAANLAVARAAGLPVVDGFVVAAELARHLADAPRPGRDGAERVEAVRRAWAALSRNGSDPVVVRSSSTGEDTATSSQAGVFESVVDVRGWDAFLDAVAQVVASAARAEQAGELSVLVQRHVDPAWGGVMFGVDPVTGRRDHLVVAAVPGGPQRLVAGAEAGSRVALDHHGRVVEGHRRDQPLARVHRRHLADLAARVEQLYGEPQDVEWAVTDGGQLLLLQSRPITAVAVEGTGPVLGPGPVAETFPDPLHALEQDLWIPPLRDALRAVLPLTGRASAREVERSPVVTVVDGRPAADLELLEPAPRRRGVQLLDPRPGLHRLRVAWRVGRLRAGLPVLVDAVVADIDRDLAAVPALDRLSDDQLLGVLWRTRAALRAAHGYELLAGVLATADSDGATAVEAAMSALGTARASHGGGSGSDAQVIAKAPEVLALLAPTVAEPDRLPALSSVSPRPGRALAQREALRMRIRWLHELSARAARVLGRRLAERGQLGAPGDIADVTLGDLADALHRGGVVPLQPLPRSTAPLPPRFRQAADGTVVTVVDPAAAVDGVGAGGGRGTGLAARGPDPAPGSVLVVATLDPRLAPVLDRLAGLVAETGSPLSHLAILARERGVPTVVGLTDAQRRFPPGTELLVDGTTGEVTVLPVRSAPAPSEVRP